MTVERHPGAARVSRDRTPSRTAPPVQRTRLPDQIANHLMRQIVESDLPPGTLLPTEVELVQRFSVGKSAVREAVRIVSTKGLVEVVQGSGMRVTPRIGIRHAADWPLRFAEAGSPWTSRCQAGSARPCRSARPGWWSRFRARRANGRPASAR